MTAEPAPHTTKTSGLAIAALVLSLLFCIPLAPLIGLVLGIVALMQIDKSKGALTGKGMAIGAIVVSLFTGVAAIGMMAAIAIPNFVRFQARAKEAEARVSLMQLRTATMAHVVEQGTFPQSDGEWAPATPCPKAGCDGNEPEWKKEPWAALQFGFYSKHYFQYRYEVTGEGKDATLTITASGDPDGDGEPTIMTVTGSISSDGNAILEGPLHALE